MSVRLALHIQPNAKKTEVAGWHGEAIKLRVHAPPVDGAANEAVVNFLSECFGISKRQVELIQGASSRSKLFELQGVTEAMLDAWILRHAGTRKEGTQ